MFINATGPTLQYIESYGATGEARDFRAGPGVASEDGEHGVAQLVGLEGVKKRRQVIRVGFRMQ